MTRINLVPVRVLSDQHLLAEHREIKRIPNCILRGRYSLEGIPDKFCLGKGHVKFFYNKMVWLATRYNELYWECERRGFNVENYFEPFMDVTLTHPELLNPEWEPSEEEINISKQRIQEKLNMRPGWYKWT